MSYASSCPSSLSQASVSPPSYRRSGGGPPRARGSGTPPLHSTPLYVVYLGLCHFTSSHVSLHFYTVLLGLQR